MTKSMTLVLLLAISCTACSKTRLTRSSELLLVSEAIDYCISEYTRITGKPMPNEVDRAYVHESSGKMGIIFAHGDVRRSEGQSDDYRSYLSCGVMTTKPLKIYIMVEPMTTPIVRWPDADEFDSDFYEHPTKELLFERKTGTAFEFKSAQELDVQDED